MDVRTLVCGLDRYITDRPKNGEPRFDSLDCSSGGDQQSEGGDYNVVSEIFEDLKLRVGMWERTHGVTEGVGDDESDNGSLSFITVDSKSTREGGESRRSSFSSTTVGGWE